MTDDLRLSYFKTRDEVLRWIDSIGWSIKFGICLSGGLGRLLVNDRGRWVCFGIDDDYCIVWADTYAYGCVDEYNHPQYKHSRRVTKLAKAALAIRSKKGE